LAVFQLNYFISAENNAVFLLQLKINLLKVEFPAWGAENKIILKN
jgi:hypothetical protein